MEGGIGWWCLFGQLHLSESTVMKSEGAGVVNKWCRSEFRVPLMKCTFVMLFSATRSRRGGASLVAFHNNEEFHINRIVFNIIIIYQ